MKNIIVFIILFLMTTYTLSSQEVNETGQITIVFENIKHSEGQIIASLHNIEQEKGFPAKDYTKVFKWLAVEIIDNTATIIFNELPAGYYALSVFHDEDFNDKLNTNSLGIPTEGFGFSNNSSTFFGPPGFEKAKIELNLEQINIIIKMKY